MGWASGRKEKLKFSVKKINQDVWIKWKCCFSTWKQCFLINKLTQITVQFLSWVVSWVVQYEFIVTRLNIISIVSPMSSKPCVLLTRKQAGVLSRISLGKGSHPLWLLGQTHWKNFCYWSKITGTSLLKQAALLDYLEDALILHSLVVIILTRASFSFHFLSNLELKCRK